MAVDFVAEFGGTFSAIPSDPTVASDSFDTESCVWDNVLGNL
jgi:hypothetical protein